VIISPRNIDAKKIATNGTKNINTLAFIAPSLAIEYIYTDVPKDIAPIETKNKLTRNLKLINNGLFKSFKSINNADIIDVKK